MSNIIPMPAILAALDNHITFVYENVDSFLKAFAKGHAFELTEVAFGGECIRIVYVLDCGQHLADSVKVDDYLKWRAGLEKQTGPVPALPGDALADEEFVNRCRIFRADHQPDGYPAVQTWEVDRLVEIIDRQAAEIRRLSDQKV